jgi:hypothetical protein
VNPLQSALDLYRDGRELVDLVRDPAVLNDDLRWMREDLDEGLLDLKLAVIDLDPDRVARASAEVSSLIALIIAWLLEHDNFGGTDGA